MDTLLAIASRRDQRRYLPEPLEEEIVTRILDAGRLAGSGSNRQPWTFVLVEDRDRIEALAPAVFAPENVLGAGLVLAVVVRGTGPVSFDAGRAAQNMMLAAWNEGVASCPNGVSDPDTAAEICGADVKLVLSFGYPATPRDPESRSVAEWSARARRKPLDELVRRV